MHLQVGVLVEDLRLPSQASRPNDGAGWELSKALGNRADEYISDVLTGQIAGQDGAGWQVGGHILQGLEAWSCMHGRLTCQVLLAGSWHWHCS